MLLAWNSFSLKIVKRYLLIYNLEVSFSFQLTFLQLNVIKMFTVLQKLFFPLLMANCFELPITRTFFDFPPGVVVIEKMLESHFLTQWLSKIVI